jgi:hypothetical protein
MVVMALAAGCDDPRLPLLFITTRSQSQLSHHAVSVTSAFQAERPAVEAPRGHANVRGNNLSAYRVSECAQRVSDAGEMLGGTPMG